MRKHFVLDTNVLLHEPEAILQFGDNEVVLPIDVIEELDTFKRQNDQLGFNARQVIRILDDLREQGNLGQGVPVGGNGGNGGGGTVRVDLMPVNLREVGLEKDNADNRILSSAWKLQRDGKPVTFVSKDMNVRIKSDAIGIKTMDYERSKVDIGRLFAGWREILVPADAIDTFFKDRRWELPEDHPGLENPINPNECVLLRDETRPKRTALARRARTAPNEVVALSKAVEGAMGISPRNLEQRFAFELLLDDSVSLLTLVGQAGTGKTLLALAAGLQRVLHDSVYEKLLVARPIIPLGRDIGYLPGSKDDKLELWMKPIFDNIKFILRGRTDPGDVASKIHEMQRSGALEMEALTYIRGRSIYSQFLIVDECQNLTPHEVKTIISRAGHETKLVLTGDPHQIDNPYLDSESNGLSYVAERMKGQSVAAHMTLTKTERSPLASVAAEIL